MAISLRCSQACRDHAPCAMKFVIAQPYPPRPADRRGGARGQQVRRVLVSGRKAGASRVFRRSTAAQEFARGTEQANWRSVRRLRISCAWAGRSRRIVPTARIFLSIQSSTGGCERLVQFFVRPGSAVQAPVEKGILFGRAGSRSWSRMDSGDGAATGAGGGRRRRHTRLNRGYTRLNRGGLLRRRTLRLIALRAIAAVSDAGSAWIARPRRVRDAATSRW